MPPITLLSLAALTPAHYDISILDGQLGEISPGDCDLAAISVIYFTAPRAYELAAWYRRRGIPVVMGGAHATLSTAEVMEHCDAVVAGEADEIWGRVLADFEAGRLKKVYRGEGKPDLTRLPPPRLDLVDLSRYDVRALVQTGRGCPSDCDFCVIPPLNGRRPRHKTVEQVTEEIRRALGGVRGRWRRRVLFSDDNIVSDPRYARELFRALIPLRIWWASQCSLSIAYDGELLDLAAASGCKGLFIGFETPTQEALDEVHKGYDSGRFAEHIGRIKERGIFILGSFIFGLDSDTRDIFCSTVDFCMANNIDFVNFHIVSPAPGTPFFDRLAGAGRLLHRRWELYQENVVFQPRNMSVQELQEGQIWAYEEFFRTANMLRRVWRYRRSPLQLLVLLSENLRFRRKMRSGIRFQRRFLPGYNREILGLGEPGPGDPLTACNETCGEAPCLQKSGTGS